MLLSFQRKLVLSLYLQGEKGETKITARRLFIVQAYKRKNCHEPSTMNHQHLDFALRLTLSVAEGSTGKPTYFSRGMSLNKLTDSMLKLPS